MFLHNKGLLSGYEESSLRSCIQSLNGVTIREVSLIGSPIVRTNENKVEKMERRK